VESEIAASRENFTQEVNAFCSSYDFPSETREQPSAASETEKMKCQVEQLRSGIGNENVSRR